LLVGKPLSGGSIKTGGEVYHGRWNQYGFVKGKGAIVTKDAKYDGEWKSDWFGCNAVGKIHYNNGDYFVGEWDNYFERKKEGHGLTTREDGKKFEGNFNDWSGDGKIISEDGSIFEGKWNIWKAWDGKGAFKTQGYKLEGEWLKGFFKGKIISENGEILEKATCECNNISSTGLSTGEGVIRLNDCKYEGIWNDNGGEGTITYEDGSTHKGNWDYKGEKIVAPAQV